jgi:hypothetical protein
LHIHDRRAFLSQMNVPLIAGLPPHLRNKVRGTLIRNIDAQFDRHLGLDRRTELDLGALSYPITRFRQHRLHHLQQQHTRHDRLTRKCPRSAGWSAGTLQCRVSIENVAREFDVTGFVRALWCRFICRRLVSINWRNAARGSLALASRGNVSTTTSGRGMKAGSMRVASFPRTSGYRKSGRGHEGRHT